MANHRSSLKKKHKAFKSRHATKGQIRNQNKGRIEKSSGAGQKHELSKLERKNQAGQLMVQKRREQEQKTKIFNGKNGCPRNVCIVPLTDDIDPHKVVSQFQDSLQGVVNESVPGTVFIPRFKQNLRFFVPQFSNFFEILDSARAADFIVFVLSATTEIADYGEKIVRCVSSQGCTTALGTIWGLENADKRAKNSLAEWFGHFFADSRLFDLNSELATCANQICSKYPSGINWRDERPYVVAEKMEVLPEGIVIDGFVRGAKLSPNQLVHLPGVGDCQISQLTAHETLVADSPESLDPLAEDAIEMTTHTPDEVTANAGVRIEGHEYVTEIIDAEEDTIKTIKNVPQGMSDYQASWLIEGEDYGLEEDGEQEADMLDEEEGELIDQQQEEEQEMDIDDEDEDGDDEEHAQQIQDYRDERSSREDLEFPDEVEFDPSISIKDRLARYRGVRDLRTVDWDANELDEKTPTEWSRLARPGNLFATKNRLAKIEYEGVAVGTHVRVYLPVTDAMKQHEAQIKKLVTSVANGAAVAIYGLLAFENKLSVVNMSITPDSEFDESLKCKDPIVVQYGPRRMQINPIYSTPGANNDNDVYKMFRYLHPGHPATVSAILPVHLSHAPVVYYTPGSNDPRLVGIGNVMDSNTKRVVVKTAIITGHPMKINKKIVSIRYMFFNSADVQWFKSVPLFTKWGCSGFIKESLGTHGFFKATFDRKINSQDTVAMALYKRVWPKVGVPAEY